MTVTIKSAAEIEKMRIAGKLAAAVLDFITPHVKPGVSTLALNDLCHDYIVNTQQAIPAPLNYGGSAYRIPFPKSVCTSVNGVVCHGIPSEKKILKSGDILNIDVTVIKDGYHGDTSKMFFIGEPSIKAKRLVKITQECMYLGIAQVKPGAKLSSIGKAIQPHAEQASYSVVREYCGHGIGLVFHEDPQVLHFHDYIDKNRPIGKRKILAYNHDEDLDLAPGMIFTVEPMINEGLADVKLEADGWTVVTKDRSLSAQFEHTILVTETGYEILTLRAEESPSIVAHA